MLTASRATKEWTSFGTTMLTLVGTLNVSQGLLVALASGGVGFNRAEVAYTTAGTWAAATVTLGVLLALAGLTLRGGRQSARLAAVSVVAMHAITQLAMLRAYPAWSLMMTALDVVILFVLTVPKHASASAESPSPAPERPEPPAPPVSPARRNSRSDVYQPRHKAGPPAAAPDLATELPIVLADRWVKAVGQAAVPSPQPATVAVIVPGSPSATQVSPAAGPASTPEAHGGAGRDAEPPLLSQVGMDRLDAEAEDMASELATMGPRPYVT